MKMTHANFMAAVAAFSMSAGSAMADMSSLRGGDLTSASAEPAKMKLMEVKGGIERSFKEQPPMVPHEVDKYEVNLKVNGCLKCHSEATYEKEKAPKIGASHYLDRDGKVLDTLSSRRYFCNQCHVPQLSGDPLVENLFEGRR